MDAPEHANARNAFSPPLLSKGSHAHARGGDDKPPVWHGGTATYSRTSMTRYPRSPSPPGELPNKNALLHSGVQLQSLGDNQAACFGNFLE